MAVHTFTNTDPGRYAHNLGGTANTNYTLKYGESVELEPWQLVDDDLIEIAVGNITVVPPLPNDLVGQGFTVSTFSPDKGPTIDKRVWELRTTAPTTIEKQALGGSSGVPGDGNKYLTETDPSVAGLYIKKVHDFAVGYYGEYWFILPETPQVAALTEVFVNSVRQRNSRDYYAGGPLIMFYFHNMGFILDVTDKIHVVYYA